jgi:hypothetical protein
MSLCWKLSLMPARFRSIYTSMQRRDLSNESLWCAENYLNQRASPSGVQAIISSFAMLVTANSAVLRSPPPYSDQDGSDSTTFHGYSLPVYQQHASITPWLETLQRPTWEDNLDLMLSHSSTSQYSQQSKSIGSTPWKAAYSVHIHHCFELGLSIDPCDDIHRDHMFNSITSEVRYCIKTEIPSELRCKRSMRTVCFY